MLQNVIIDIFLSFFKQNPDLLWLLEGSGVDAAGSRILAGWLFSRESSGHSSLQQPFIPWGEVKIVGDCPPNSQPESGSLPPFPALPAPNPQEYIPLLLLQLLQVPTSHNFLLHILPAFAPAHTPCDILWHSHGQVWLAGSCSSLQFCSSPAQIPVLGWGNPESPLGEKTFPGHSGHETGGSFLLQICPGSLGP